MSRDWSRWTRPVGVFRVPGNNPTPWRAMCLPCGEVIKATSQIKAARLAHKHATHCRTFQVMLHQFRP